MPAIHVVCTFIFSDHTEVKLQIFRKAYIVNTSLQKTAL